MATQKIQEKLINSPSKLISQNKLAHKNPNKSNRAPSVAIKLIEVEKEGKKGFFSTWESATHLESKKKVPKFALLQIANDPLWQPIKKAALLNGYKYTCTLSSVPDSVRSRRVWRRKKTMNKLFYRGTLFFFPPWSEVYLLQRNGEIQAIHCCNMGLFQWAK